MILPRKEFYDRWNFRDFDTHETIVDFFPVDELMDEAEADAPFRNKSFMFDPKADWNKVSVEHDEVGVNKYCDAGVKTEEERIKYVEGQIERGTYEPVPIFQDIDYPSIIYIDDGFHRIFAANSMGRFFIKCRIKRGKFKLVKSINAEELLMLTTFLLGAFKDAKDMKHLNNILRKIPEDKRLHTSFHYGREKINTENFEKAWRSKDEVCKKGTKI